MKIYTYKKLFALLILMLALNAFGIDFATNLSANQQQKADSKAIAGYVCKYSLHSNNWLLGTFISMIISSEKSCSSADKKTRLDGCGIEANDSQCVHRHSEAMIKTFADVTRQSMLHEQRVDLIYTQGVVDDPYIPIKSFAQFGISK